MLRLVALSGALVTPLRKELKIGALDAGLASPLVHYLLMASVSLTTVGAFQTAGALPIVSFIVWPLATAYLPTDRLGTMLWLSMAIGAASAVAGYWLAYGLDASIAARWPS